MYLNTWLIYNEYRQTIGLILLVLFSWYLMNVIGKWNIFKKAGKKGWYALIPFYDMFVLFALTWGNGWLFLLNPVFVLLSRLGTIGWVFKILSFLVKTLFAYKLSLAFGHGIGYAVGLFFLQPIFLMIIGLENSHYYGIPQDRMTYDDIREYVHGFDRKDMTFKKDNNIVDRTTVDAEFEEQSSDDKHA